MEFRKLDTCSMWPSSSGATSTLASLGARIENSIDFKTVGTRNVASRHLGSILLINSGRNL
jgi:hypothetical protein